MYKLVLESLKVVANSQCRGSATSASLTATNLRLRTELTSIQQAGTWKSERVICTPQAASVRVDNRERPLLNFCSNNYLGLSYHPDVIEAGKQALDEFGAGLSSVRFICGTQSIHKKLERQISDFHGREDTILYASCFDANAGLFEALLSAEDCVLSDELNHASIIDGVRLCKARKFRYKHADMTDLELQLKQCTDARTRIIVSDGVFSMDGAVCPLPHLVRLAQQYDALVFLDDCHATGFFGPSGRGTEEYYGMSGSVDIINSTLGKALGGAAGGYTTASREIVDLLRQRSRPYLFSNSLPPPVVACASQVLDMLSSSSQLIRQLDENTRQFRAALTSAGFSLAGHQQHAIVPVMIGDAKLAQLMADSLLDHGIYVVGFSYPVVPLERARIRVQLSASHSAEQVQHAVAAFISVGKQYGIVN